MAVNPLYKNEYYFFSNMYDDSLITEFFRKISAETYERSIQYQQNMLGRKRYSSDSSIFYKAKLGDFVIDDKYNSTIGIPIGSRTLTFNTLILPVYNKKKYLSTYGVKYKKIPITDFYKKTDIFDKIITVQIGKYHILTACIIENADKTVTLAIPNSTTEGISTAYFDKLLADYSTDEPVWIFTNEITQTYFMDTTSANSISNSPLNGYYDVKITKTHALNNIKNVNNHSYQNSWDCLMSFNSNKYGRKILVSSPCSLKSTSASQLIFSVDENFINMIKANSTNFNLYFIHRPNRKHVLLYPYNKDTYPILNLDYTYNPTGNINIEVYEIDTATMCKGRKLYNPNFTQVYFPNIFDFSSINVNNSNLLIEITEYDPSYTNQIMNNSISPLIESLGPELYTEFVVNDHDKSLNGTSMELKNYHPTNYPISLNEYLNSEYYGNFRGYMLDKIEKIIESDPYLIASYYDWMNSLNNKVVSLSGTPKTLRFGTDKTGEFKGSNKIVMDTSIVSINSDDIQYFSEQHSYITYYSNMKECPAIIYINGKYVRPTCTRFYKGLNYLFFPVSVINAEMARYASDTEVINASPITVDMYPSSYNSLVDSPKDMITIESASDIIKLFDHLDEPKFSIDELVLYDNTTGKYLGSLLDIFNISLNVSEYIINTNGAVDSVLVSRAEGVEYLLTLLGEVYNTSDAIPIVLEGNKVTLNINEYIDYLIDNKIITKEESVAFTHKVLNFKDIDLTPKDNSLIGMSISIYSRNFKQEYLIKSNSGVYNAETDTTTYTLKECDLDPDTSRYFIFNDGCFDKNANIIKVDNKINGTMNIELMGNQTTENKDILLVHMPIGYYPDTFTTSSRVFYMKPAVTSEIETALLWPEGENDGLLLQLTSGRLFNSFSFENEINIKYSDNGLRLPPKSKSVNSLYGMYYDATRAAACGLTKESRGIVYFIDTDMPPFNIVKQNPYSDSYDASYAKNPLDILTCTK